LVAYLVPIDVWYVIPVYPTSREGLRMYSWIRSFDCVGRSERASRSVW